MRFECRHCGGKSFWKLRNGEYRCKNCRKDFKPVLVTRMKLTRKEWVKLVDLYLIGVNDPIIAKQINRNITTVSKAMKLLRVVMTKDVPDIFEGTVEVDEIYLGGQKKNKTKTQLMKEILTGEESKRGRGTTKQPVFRYFNQTRQGVCQASRRHGGRKLTPDYR